MEKSGILDADTERAARLFADRLRERHPTARAMLYGSRARGDHVPESDADVAVILPHLAGTRAAEAGALADIAFGVLLETGVLVSPLPLTESEMARPSAFGNPALVESIRRDGVGL